eukprot:gene36344-48949_t
MKVSVVAGGYYGAASSGVHPTLAPLTALYSRKLIAGTCGNCLRCGHGRPTKPLFVDPQISPMGGASGMLPRRDLPPRMITGLDHVVVLLNDIEKAAAAYQLLLGRAPSWRNQSDGTETVLFTLDNMTLELMSPKGNSANATRIRKLLKIWGEGLASLCFRIDDIVGTRRRLERVALQPDAIVDVERRDTVSGATLAWKRFRTATEMTRSFNAAEASARTAWETAGRTPRSSLGPPGRADSSSGLHKPDDRDERMRNISLRQLRSVTAIHRHGKIVSAAAEL